jgi:microcystin-dependent protein
MIKIPDFRSALASIVCAGFVLASTYLFLPPPHHASAQYEDQGTWGGTSAGSVNAQTITIANLSANKPGIVLRFIPGFTNTGPTQVNVSGIGLVNVLRPSSIGLVAFSGQEFQAGEATCITYNNVASAYQLACNVDMTRIGQTIEVRGSVAPRGSLIEDGSCVSTTTYAALNTVIGTTYGTCSAGLFKLPFSNGTAFVAFDGQGANGAANRITVSCASPNSPVLCGTETKTLGAGQIPTISFTGSGSGSASVTSTGSSWVSSASGLSSFSGSVGGSLGMFASSGGNGTSAISSSGSASVSVTGTSNNTGGGAHSVENPILPGIRAIKY